MTDTESRQPSCEERIEEQAAGRAEWFRELVRDFDAGGENEDGGDAEAALYESPLAITRRDVYRVELSFGGPQDYLEVHVDPEDHEITRITYHFLDWFDGAVRTLKGDELEAASEYVQRLIPFDV